MCLPLNAWGRVLSNKDVNYDKSTGWVWKLITLVSSLCLKGLSRSGSLIIEGFPASCHSILPSVVFLGFRFPHWEENSSALARLPLRAHPDTNMLNPSNGRFGPPYSVAVLEILLSHPYFIPVGPSPKMLVSCLFCQSHFWITNWIPILGVSCTTVRGMPLDSQCKPHLPVNGSHEKS